MRILLAAVWAAAVCVAVCSPRVAAAGLRVMPWMCLERCGENITADIDSLHSHVSQLSAVSFEAYNVGPNATFVDNGFTRVAATLSAWGVETYAMLTTRDIYNIRALFAQPQPFMSDALAAAKASHITGFNVDFEPCQDAATEKLCTDDDAADFALFLNSFADYLHGGGVRLTVDVASWSPFWNFTRIAATRVDRVITMDTYATSLTYFQQSLQKALDHFSIDRLGIGLCSDCAKTPLGPADMQPRFDAIHAAGVLEVDIWEAPIPEFWYPMM